MAGRHNTDPAAEIAQRQRRQALEPGLAVEARRSLNKSEEMTRWPDPVGEGHQVLVFYGLCCKAVPILRTTPKTIRRRNAHTLDTWRDDPLEPRADGAFLPCSKTGGGPLILQINEMINLIFNSLLHSTLYRSKPSQRFAT